MTKFVSRELRREVSHSSAPALPRLANFAIVHQPNCQLRKLSYYRVRLVIKTSLVGLKLFYSTVNCVLTWKIYFSFRVTVMASLMRIKCYYRWIQFRLSKGPFQYYFPLVPLTVDTGRKCTVTGTRSIFNLANVRWSNRRVSNFLFLIPIKN